MLGFVWALSQGGVLAEMAEKNPNVVVVSQDMGPLSPFSDNFPDRFFDVGISEGNLIGVAAGADLGNKQWRKRFVDPRELLNRYALA